MEYLLIIFKPETPVVIAGEIAKSMGLHLKWNHKLGHVIMADKGE